MFFGVLVDGKILINLRFFGFQVSIVYLFLSEMLINLLLLVFYLEVGSVKASGNLIFTVVVFPLQHYLAMQIYSVLFSSVCLFSESEAFHLVPPDDLPRA